MTGPFPQTQTFLGLLISQLHSGRVLGQSFWVLSNLVAPCRGTPILAFVTCSGPEGKPPTHKRYLWLWAFVCSYRKTLNTLSWTEYEPRGDFRLWINGQKSPISSPSPDPLFAHVTVGLALSFLCWLLGCHGHPSHVSEDRKSKPQVSRVCSDWAEWRGHHLCGFWELECPVKHPSELLQLWRFLIETFCLVCQGLLEFQLAVTFGKGKGSF